MQSRNEHRTQQYTKQYTEQATDQDAEHSAQQSTAPMVSWEQLARLVWQATAAIRHELHLRMRGTRCPTKVAPYSGRPLRSANARAECEAVGCLDVFHDVLVTAYAKLRDLATTGDVQARDPERYAYRTITRLLTDGQREQRVRLGFDAKPGREDGPAARVISALWALDPEHAQWLVTLLRLMQHYAHKPGRASATWPLLGWAAEKSTLDHLARPDTEATREEIRADVAAVLRVATATLGAAWVREHIHHPLVVAQVAASFDSELPAPAQDVDSALLASWFRTRYAVSRRGGMNRADALRAAAAAVGWRADIADSREIRAALRDLDADLGLSA